MRLLLVDGTNVLMRCVSVQREVPRADVIASALRIVERAAADPIHATHLVVAFDGLGACFRRELYPQYKAHRADRTEDTRAWAVDAYTAFTAAGVYCVSATGFEADDVIATLAARVPRALPSSGQPPHEVNEVHILSGDSDLLALASDDPLRPVRCWRFGQKGEDRIVHRSAAWIAAKYGIASPALLTDYKALIGEPGDGVPGVRGVGPVRAQRLLAEFGSLERINAFGMLKSQADWALQARALIQLRTDAPVPPIAPSACRRVRRAA
jgi:5'-3' exonuclease